MAVTLPIHKIRFNKKINGSYPEVEFTVDAKNVYIGGASLLGFVNLVKSFFNDGFFTYWGTKEPLHDHTMDWYYLPNGWEN